MVGQLRYHMPCGQQSKTKQNKTKQNKTKHPQKQYCNKVNKYFKNGAHHFFFFNGDEKSDLICDGYVVVM